MPAQQQHGPPTGHGKDDLRALIRQQRRDRSEAERGRQRTLIADAVLQWCQANLAVPATVAAYEPWPSEPVSADLLAGLAAAGHRVLVPVTLPDRTLDWRMWTGPAAASGSADALLGPAALAQAALVLVPAFAVDSAGRRLGRGGGSYDRALPWAATDAVLAAVLFSGEDGHPVPVDDWDVGVNAIVTPAGFVRLGTGRLD